MQNTVYLRQIIYIYCEHHVKHINTLCSKKRRSIMLQQVAQPADQAMVEGGGGFSSMQCGGVLTASGNYWTATGRSSTALQLYTD